MINDINLAIKQGRRIAHDTFVQTLNDLLGKSRVTEYNFLKTWMSYLSKHNEMTKDGWYSPPPSGASILFSSEELPSRLSFTSLRESKYFPSNVEIDWSYGYLFAYCSNIIIPFQFPSDFSITLYFGKKKEIKNHFKKCHRIAREIVNIACNLENSIELFQASERLTVEVGLKNTVFSITDKENLDYGHSLETVSLESLADSRKVTPEICNAVSKSRRFINRSDFWSLKEVSAFTIEPQLISIEDPSMPKVALHYILSKKNESFIEDNFEKTLNEFELCDV